MSSANMGYIQYPIMQASTTQHAMVKHRHLLELSLLKGGLTVQNNVQVLFSKPESSARDTRSLSQPALATFHSSFAESPWQVSIAVREGKLGPCPLIRVADLQGFDDDSKPSPGARAEQLLGSVL